MIEKSYLALFAAVFLAELGDKTQLVTLLSAADGQRSPWLVFIASASALVLSAGVAVLAGAAFAKQMQMIPLKLIAGVCFIALGMWTIIGHYRAA